MLFHAFMAFWCWFFGAWSVYTRDWFWALFYAGFLTINLVDLLREVR